MREFCTVRLPRDQAPLFPQFCVGCGGAPDMHLVRGRHFLSSFRIGQGQRFRVPVCAPCKRTITKGLTVRTTLLLAAVGGVIAAGLYLKERFGIPFGATKLVGLFLVGFGYVLLSRRPLPFDYEVEDDVVEYRFRSPVCGQEFARLNNATIAPESAVFPAN